MIQINSCRQPTVDKWRSIPVQIEKTDPLYIQVYEQLKKSILQGSWNPGDKLIESKIAS